MRTIEQAIQEETQRFVETCRKAATAVKEDQSGEALAPPSVRRLVHKAHIHALAIRRLRHHVVTNHEAVCAATPTVHAYADLDGYSR